MGGGELQFKQQRPAPELAVRAVQAVAVGWGGAGRFACQTGQGVEVELAGARRSRSAINSKVGGGLLWGEVGSLLILRIIDAFQHSFYNSIDNYLPTEPPPVQDFLLLEKSRQVMIEEVGGGSLAFRNIGST